MLAHVNNKYCEAWLSLIRGQTLTRPSATLSRCSRWERTRDCGSPIIRGPLPSGEGGRRPGEGLQGIFHFLSLSIGPGCVIALRLTGRAQNENTDRAYHPSAGNGIGGRYNQGADHK